MRRGRPPRTVWSARAGRPDPGEPCAVRDNKVGPAASKLREILSELEISFGRGQAIAEAQLKGNRDAATTALILFAGLILVGLVWLLADVNRRILAPCASAWRALGGLGGGH